MATKYVCVALELSLHLLEIDLVRAHILCCIIFNMNFKTSAESLDVSCRYVQYFSIVLCLSLHCQANLHLTSLV